MSEYGLTVHELDYTKRKITKQREFLENNKFTTSKGKVKSLLDISYSANHSERYYTQLLNKVHTMNSYNMNLNNVPIFMTVTLDAPFHEMIEGKFTKFYKKYKIVHSQIVDKKTNEIVTNLVPNDERYGKLIDAIEEERRLSVKDLYRILSFQLYGFQRSYIFKKIKKEQHEISYLRVTEPMKSGVPHFHLLFYTQEKYIKGLYDSFHKYFSAPQNRKPLTYRDNKRICTKPLPCGTMETQGFQWDINSATGYVLKYVLKSFRNVQSQEDIDYLQSWYIMHRIPRIITTKTLIPQWVYHITSILEKDWYYLTYLKTDHYFSSDPINKKFEFHDNDFGRKIIFDNGLLQIWNKGKLMSSYGKKKFTVRKIRLKSLTFSTEKPFYNKSTGSWMFCHPAQSTFDKNKQVRVKANPKEVVYKFCEPFSLLKRYEIYQSDLTKKPHKEHCFEDDTEIMISNGGLDFMLTFLGDMEEPIREKILSFKEMSNLTLLELYSSNSEQTMLSARYWNLHNELVSRGLLYADYLSLQNGQKREKSEYFESSLLEDSKELIFKKISGGLYGY